MKTEDLSIAQTARGSFRAIEASNGLVAFTVLPELGAKIVSLRDLRSGREWLWSSDRLPLSHHPYGASYIEKADTGGWDECFPTVAPCAYPLEPQLGRALPDHGDLWSQAWNSKMEHGAQRVEIVASCAAIAVPCRFTRTLSLRSATTELDMHYSVHNDSQDEVAFIWSAHPLLRIEPGMVLEFPTDARFNVYSATERTQLARREGLQWPIPVRRDAHDVSLARLPGPDAGIAFKIWSEPLTQGWSRLIASDGALHLRFDVAEIPQIALWLNAGGWSGIGGDPYYNIALEPCIGAQDSLAEAVTRHRMYGLLRPGETRRWTLTVDLQASRRN
jgi:galactose mutarotase-like enzyme